MPLHIDDTLLIPSSDKPFIPYFNVEKLKEAIGRKGRLYIRPLTTVRGSLRVSEVEVNHAQVWDIFNYTFLYQVGLYSQRKYQVFSMQ